MSVVYKTFDGASRSQFEVGIPISSFAGPEPNGPIVGWMLTAEQVDILNQETVFHIAPNMGGSSGWASDGFPDEDPVGVFSIAASVTASKIDGPEFPNRYSNIDGFIDIDLLGEGEVAAVSSQPDFPINFRLQIGYKDPLVPEDWLNPGPPVPPTNITHDEVIPSVDPLKPTETDQVFTWDIPPDPDNDGTIIARDDVVIVVLPPGVYEYTDTVPGDDYVYTFWYFTWPGDGISEPTILAPITTNGDPESPPEEPEAADIEIISDMALALDWNSIMAFITDPSGIYGLIPNKTHDTLYNRNAEQTSINMKIPDPFIRTAFFPEE